MIPIKKSAVKSKSSVKIVKKAVTKMEKNGGKSDTISDKHLRAHEKAKSLIALNRSLNFTNQTLTQEIKHLKTQATENDKTIAQFIDKQQRLTDEAANLKTELDTLSNQHKNLEVNYHNLVQLVKNMEKKLEMALSENNKQTKELEALKNRAESPIPGPSTNQAPSRKRRKQKTPSNTSSEANSNSENEIEEMEAETEAQIKDPQNPTEDYPQLRNPVHKNPLSSQHPNLSTQNNPTTQKSLKQNESPEKPKIPPIIIRDPKYWLKIHKLITENHVNIEDPKKHPLGIQILPKTSDDHRTATKLLKEKNVEYHTYFLKEEKKLNIIIKGLGKKFSLDDVENELLELGFGPSEIQWYKSGPNRNVETELIKLLIPQDQTEIFKITHICHMRVYISHQRAPTTKHIPQCHNCQKFGHCSSNCFAEPKCHRCAGNHHYKDCKKPRDTPAKCLNCEGDHPASFRNCPKNPNYSRNQPNQTSQNTNTNQTSQISNTPKPPPKPINPQISYAKITQSPSTPSQNPQSPILNFLSQNNQDLEQKIDSIISRIHTKIEQNPLVKAFLTQLNG